MLYRYVLIRNNFLVALLYSQTKSIHTHDMAIKKYYIIYLLN